MHERLAHALGASEWKEANVAHASSAKRKHDGLNLHARDAR
jgi:hypothetical protein